MIWHAWAYRFNSDGYTRLPESAQDIAHHQYTGTSLWWARDDLSQHCPLLNCQTAPTQPHPHFCTPSSSPKCTRTSALLHPQPQTYQVQIRHLQISTHSLATRSTIRRVKKRCTRPTVNHHKPICSTQAMWTAQRCCDISQWRRLEPFLGAPKPDFKAEAAPQAYKAQAKHRI